MLIPQTLRWAPQQGSGIGQAIRAGSGYVLQAETGSLYPALHRLEKQGWIKSEWETSDHNQRAKYWGRLNSRVTRGHLAVGVNGETVPRVLQITQWPHNRPRKDRIPHKIPVLQITNQTPPPICAARALAAVLPLGNSRVGTPVPHQSRSISIQSPANSRRAVRTERKEQERYAQARIKPGGFCLPDWNRNPLSSVRVPGAGIHDYDCCRDRQPAIFKCGMRAGERCRG
jgi:hypothetical protein